MYQTLEQILERLRLRDEWVKRNPNKTARDYYHQLKAKE